MSNYREIIYPEDKKNTYPMKLSKHLLDRFLKDKVPNECKILDVGCSVGTWLDCFSESGDYQLYGTDIRDENIKNATFEACNLESEKLPFEDDMFDFVFSKSVAEHVKNTDNILSEVKRVLKPGGIFVCMVPDWKSQMSIYWDDYTHVKPFTQKGLRDALMIHGYSDVGCEYFYQLPFTWKYPYLKFIPKLVSALVPDFFKWKDSDQRNTKDRKIVRFSKELMLLAYGSKN